LRVFYVCLGSNSQAIEKWERSAAGEGKHTTEQW